MAGPMARTSAGNLPPPPSPSKTASSQPAAQSSNRQESHRIYLQFFAPRSPGRAVDQSRGHTSSTLTAASSTSRAGMGPVFHRHDSHEIHPPKYPMTAPGAPYPFSSSSSSESSASYSFSSSLSSVPNSFHGATSGIAGNGGNNSSHHPPSGHRSRGNATPSFHSRHDDGHPHSRSQSNHRNHSVIHGANHNPTPNPTPNRTDKPKFAGYPPTTTTSAAVRLTDRARARDVTALLRGKFGLPPLPDRSRSRGREGGDGDGGEIDALVLVGTMERPPRGYLRFEHEEFLEERSRLEAFRTYRAHAQRKRHVLMQQQQQQSQQSDRNESADGGASSDARNSLQNQDDARMEYQTQHRQLHEFQWSDPSLTETIRASNLQRQPLPISNSAATIRASGAQGALDQSSSSLASHGGLSGGSLVFDAGASGRSGSHDILQRNISREQSSPIGVRESGNSGSGSGSAIGLDLSSSRGSSVFGGSGSRSASSWGAMVGQTVNDISNSADETATSPTAVEKGKITTWSSRTKLTTLVSELSDSEHDMSSTPQKEGPPADASAAVAAASDGPFTVRVPGEPHAQQTTVLNKSRTLPNQRSVRPIPLDYDYDSEPIHIVRTVRPEEHPLRVRDEMFTRLIEMRLKAEMEMGLRLGDIDDADDDDADNNKPTKPKNSRRNLPATQPTFRWYFQPCCALGECGTTARSPKIQNIPSYVDLEGYCTGTDEEMEEEDERESDDGDGARPKSGISSQEVMPVLSSRMRQLAKERRRISLLQDLPDPSFLVSGYLLKQSSKDPNVWRRVFCVLSADRMWIVGRMKPLVSTSERNSGSGYAIEEFLSSLRVGRHSSIKLHRSLLLMGGSGDDHDPNPTTSSNCNNPVVSPLNRRLPNAFRIWTANGECHTFRAYTLASFRVWTRSLMEKITLKHGDDLMELADLIAEGENLARSRRMEELAVTPFMDKIVNATGALDSLNTTGIMMHVTRFGMLVSEYRELCRHTNDAVRPNHGMVLNVRTKVGSTLRPIATRQIPGGNVRYKNTPLAAIRLSRDDERVGMIAAVWEEARVVASRSAQLLHALAALQQGTTVQNNSHGCLASNTDVDVLDLINGLVKEQKEVQSILGQRWNDFSSVPQTHPHTKDQFSGATCNESTNERKNILALPPTHLFDSMVEKFQNVSALTSV